MKSLCNAPILASFAISNETEVHRPNISQASILGCGDVTTPRFWDGWTDRGSRDLRKVLSYPKM